MNAVCIRLYMPYSIINIHMFLPLKYVLQQLSLIIQVTLGEQTVHIDSGKSSFLFNMTDIKLTADQQFLRSVISTRKGHCVLCACPGSNQFSLVTTSSTERDQERGTSLTTFHTDRLKITTAMSYSFCPSKRENTQTNRRQQTIFTECMHRWEFELTVIKSPTTLDLRTLCMVVSVYQRGRFGCTIARLFVSLCVWFAHLSYT